ncbi:MAG: hypothetical protein LBB64_05970 [Dysgonamonadaceae bacterium]|jgi:hypothetical protein|nr:hypothetical protein [Dysgonamonadaceae bacterium]
MIHCFNPGHETAVLNASKHYQPAANLLKMQRDLAFLPAWYADPGDFVWVEEDLTDTFRRDIRDLHCNIHPLTVHQIKEKANALAGQRVELWGLSPQSIHRFGQISRQYGLGWQVPAWKEAFRSLGSRTTACHVLTCLTQAIPELNGGLIPTFVSSREELEEYVGSCPGKWLVKSPFSSSGRGLVWLPPGAPGQSERQIIGGMLKRQSQVSIERALDKVMDFSMHFGTNAEGHIRFTGYSVFRTNEKGAYKSTCIAAQETLEKQISRFIRNDLLLQVKNELLHILPQTYAPYDSGHIGVDMLVYRTGNEYALHPCVEINMRKSMGYLAIVLQQKYLHSQTKASFQIDYEASPGRLPEKHCLLKQQHPAVIENGRMLSGYLSLCPVTDAGCYHAYLLCEY